MLQRVEHSNGVVTYQSPLLRESCVTHAFSTRLGGVSAGPYATLNLGSLLQETGRQIAASREDERLRIAREIHDGPLQDLQALHMQLGITAEALGRNEEVETATRRVRGGQDDAHTAIVELRSIMEALRPPAIGPFGLAAALHSHAERF